MGKGFLEENEDVINFVLAIILLLAVAFTFTAVEIFFSQGEVVATVNGEDIYESELKSRMKDLPTRMQESYTREMILNQIIQEKLLQQTIDELGLKASKSEIDQQLQAYMERQGLNETTLNRVLEMQGMSKDHLRTLMEEQVLINKLLKQEIGALNISEEELRKYYENHAEEFIVPKKATVMQTLVSTRNRSRAEARAIANNIWNQAKSQGFQQLCNISLKYLGSRESACGTYNVTKRSGLPSAFINKSMQLRNDQSEVINTSLGYHVVYKVSTTDERVQRFNSVKSQIEEQMLQAQKQRAYRQYLSQLRDNATIQNYLLDKQIKNLTQQSDENQMNITSCIAQNAVLFGAKWDTKTQQQVKKLGKLSKQIKYVECSLPNTLKEQRQVCEDKNIEAYPTWIVNGKQYKGVQSLERLRTITNCS